MFCKKCGKQIEDSATSCVFCGTPTMGDGTPVAAPGMVAQANQANAAPASSNAGICAFFGVILGLIAGVPLSYYFQNEAVRQKFTLGGYLKRIVDVVKDDQCRNPVIIACVVCAVVFGVIGALIGKSGKKS